MPRELNPNHPVTRELHDEWHKLCALIMVKHGISEIEITSADIDQMIALWGDAAAVVADMRGGRCVLRLVNAEAAARIAREEGGLPN